MPVSGGHDDFQFYSYSSIRFLFLEGLCSLQFSISLSLKIVRMAVQNIRPNSAVSLSACIIRVFVCIFIYSLFFFSDFRK